jgi:hypothetical protein
MLLVLVLVVVVQDVDVMLFVVVMVVFVLVVILWVRFFVTMMFVPNWDPHGHRTTKATVD